MKAVAAVGRIWLIFTWSVVTSLQAPLVRPVLAWSEHWVANRSSILMFTAANTAITTATEAGARTIWPLVTGQEEHGVGSSRVDLQACKLEYSIVSPK